MEFKEFKEVFQNYVNKMMNDNDFLFTVDVDKDKLWETYLNSFPEGTNKVYRKRREFDCSCCRQFIKTFGNIVAINNSNNGIFIETIWDFKIKDKKYQTVINALSNTIRSSEINNVFLTKESFFGTNKNCELSDSETKTWHHFYIKLQEKFITKSNKSIPTLIGEYRDIRNVFNRSLEEISEDAIETVLDLISQKSLYKGEEWEISLIKFLSIHKKYHKLYSDEKKLYCWLKSVEVGNVIGKIKNHSIGVLLQDITNGIELNNAVGKYENIVAPTNYQRPKAIFTKKMIEEAKKTIIELGFENSLKRRFATIDDITINNILFANKKTKQKIKDDIFLDLEKDAIINIRNFKQLKEVTIEKFVNDILPRTTSIELLLENKHQSNMVSLIAPEINDTTTMFKWKNNFSWAYHGNITDSIKQRVKNAGGNVEGVLRFSIQWNEDNENENDFDAHCIEPNGNHIYFPNKREKHPSTGMLDVDIINPDGRIAVENITWASLNKMQEGIYLFYVHCYTYRNGRSGFKAQIEFDGQIYEYEYNKELKQDEKVIVAKINFTKKNGIVFLESLDSSISQKTIWGIQTNQFHPVSVVMFSPNYWDERKGVGNKHYFFMIDGCKNDTNPNGFFNEFLNKKLIKHKRVFEALGGKMKVESSDNQLSGIGFSSTQKNSVICKIQGYVKRTIKIIF